MSNLTSIRACGRCGLVAATLVFGVGCSTGRQSPVPNGGDGSTPIRDAKPSADFPRADIAIGRDARGDRGPADARPDRGVDAPPPRTFTVTGKLTFDSKLACTGGTSGSDCKGDLHWGVFDSQPMPGTPQVWASVLKGISAGSTYRLGNVPVKPKLWVAAFVDDDANASTSKPEADTGDPVFIAATPISPKVGQTITYDILFSFRLP